MPTFTRVDSHHLSFSDVVTFKGLLPPMRVPLCRLRRIFCSSSCERGCRLLSSSASSIGPLDQSATLPQSQPAGRLAAATYPVMAPINHAIPCLRSDAGIVAAGPFQMQICAVQPGFWVPFAGAKSGQLPRNVVVAKRRLLTRWPPHRDGLAGQPHGMQRRRHGMISWLQSNRVGASVVVWNQ
jgi:hypothetical protein